MRYRMKDDNKTLNLMRINNVICKNNAHYKRSEIFKCIFCSLTVDILKTISKQVNLNGTKVYLN